MITKELNQKLSKKQYEKVEEETPLYLAKDEVEQQENFIEYGFLQPLCETCSPAQWWVTKAKKNEKQTSNSNLVASFLQTPNKLSSPYFLNNQEVDFWIKYITRDIRRNIVLSGAAVMRKLSLLSGVLILLFPYLITSNNSLDIPMVGSTLVAFQASLMALISIHKRPKLALFFEYTAVCAMLVALCILALSTVRWAALQFTSL